MSHWYMLSVVGKDQIGIVASLTQALNMAGCYLGEASMMRLGGNFSIMLMVRYAGDLGTLEKIIAPIAKTLSLKFHMDAIEGGLHQHDIPDVSVTVCGQDRTGIVAKATRLLADAGLNILNLESDVGGDDSNPIYIMHIEGKATQGIEKIQQCIASQPMEGIEFSCRAIDTLLG